MLMPSRVKYRKSHRSPLRGVSKGGTTVAFGDWGIQALENVWLTARQIEATRVAISRKMKKGGKIWIRVFPELAAEAFRTASHKLPVKVRIVSREGMGGEN